ncbi:MAG: hypothetical protein J5494_07730, partial [Candidatus Methanomethylophilaceae archaeon]|nr:hypothetical protein [Candidatus Methanomethylophilaceae archaeon]
AAVRLESIQKEIGCLAEEEENCETLMTGLREKASGEKACRMNLEALSESLNEISGIEKTLAEIGKLSDENFSLKEQLDAKIGQCAAMEKKKTDMDALYIRSQAGLMAEKLQEGVPCPVCGSPDHPRPAVLQENVPSEAELKKAGNDLKKVKEERELLLGKVTSHSANIEALKKTAEEKTGASFNDIPETISRRRVSLEEGKHRSESELKDILLSAEKLKEAGKKLEECRNKTEYLRGTYRELSEKTIADKETLSALNEKLRRSEEMCEGMAPEDIRIRLKASENSFSSLNALITGTEKKKAENDKTEASLLSSVSAAEEHIKTETGKYLIKKAETENILKELGIDEEKLTELENTDTDALGKEIDSFIRERENNNGILGRLKSKLSDTEPPDLDHLKTIKEEKEKKCEELRRRSELAARRLDSNTVSEKALESALPVLGKLLEESEDLRLLSNAASGKLTGEMKVPFDQYIQTVYFDSILELANGRLGSMTGGRYVLVRKTEGNRKSQSALDLDVTDNYTGQQRSVKTLSGGESFKAALSLALGLSDMIRLSSGGMQI